ncbi:hypothetical protein LX12_003108 [Williamsia serinedens]|uniref:Uncharacterized protein n=1 Tax=Williamsia serinedens TaxID=391736 RepID=A0ABT1H3U5_9NOCA|nr:hypothetical protein [Williamsia serinedens]
MVWSRLLGVVSAAAALIVTAGPALAAPSDPIAPQPLSAVGTASTAQFDSPQAQYSLTVPVDPGTLPTELRGTAQLPPGVTAGTVDAYSGDRFLSRVVLGSDPSQPVRWSLAGIPVTDNAADITLRTDLTGEGTCRFDPDTPFRVVGMTVAYTGNPTVPATVADFLPPVLTAIDLFIPSTPSPTEASAAINLATAVVGRYKPTPIAVRTRALPASGAPDVAQDPTVRQIMLAESAARGTALRTGAFGPYLQIGGRGSDLLAQAQLITSQMSTVAVASAAIAGQSATAPQITPTVRTLADLGVGESEASGTGRAVIGFGIDQTRLGGPAHDVRFEVRGTYTPLPSNGGGRIVVRTGTTTIASWPTAASGSIDRWVDVPDRLLRRYLDVTVSLERGDDQGGCGQAQRVSISLDPTAPVQFTRADPPIPTGLGSMPQALQPRAQFAWTRGDLADVSRAVTIAAGLQSLTVTPLGVDVVPIDEARASSTPAVIIDADGSARDIPTLPVSARGDVVTLDPLAANAQAGRRQSLTLSPTVKLGALQVTRSNGRSVLVASSNGNPAQLDAVLRWLTADPRRWSNLDGAALLAVDDRTPVLVPQPDSTDTTAADTGGGSDSGVIVATAGSVAAVLVVAGAAWFVWRRVRRRGER